MKRSLIAVVFALALAGASHAEEVDEKKPSEQTERRPSAAERLAESRELGRQRAMQTIIESAGHAEATKRFLKGPLSNNKDAQTAFIIMQNQRIIELLEEMARRQ